MGIQKTPYPKINKTKPGQTIFNLTGNQTNQSQPYIKNAVIECYEKLILRSTKNNKEYTVFLNNITNTIHTFDDIILNKTSSDKIRSEAISDANNINGFCPLNSIRQEFFEESKEKCDLMFLNYCGGDYYGIAFVLKKDKSLYIDLICNGRELIRRTRSKKDAIDVTTCKSGKDILGAIEKKAIELSLNVVELSSIDSAINYYIKNGYNFKKNPKSQDELIKIQQLYNDNFEDALTKIYEEHFEFNPDVTNEEKDKIKEGYSNDLNEGTKFIRHFGVKMEKILNTSDSSTNVTSGGKYKRKIIKNTKKRTKRIKLKKNTKNRIKGIKLKNNTKKKRKK